MKARSFLTAEWRYLAMLNYAVDPSVLRRFVPFGTELDCYQGDYFVSVVGFRFLNTRVLGWAFPFHRNFEEVNLRFYVRRHAPEGWKRGVVFIRELVPRRVIAYVARTCYGEPYSALPMRHKIDHTAQRICVEYGWQRQGRWESIRAAAEGQSKPIAQGSLEEFITEHYLGYTLHKAACAEYQVEHPRWQVWRASEATLDADVPTLYGDSFAASLSSRPASAFIADGSWVVVRRSSEFLASEPNESDAARAPISHSFAARDLPSPEKTHSHLQGCVIAQMRFLAMILARSMLTSLLRFPKSNMWTPSFITNPLFGCVRAACQTKV
jgi:hypothetical protein